MLFRYAIIIVLALTYGLVSAQTPQTHTPKVYTDAKGRVYLNQAQPFYLHLSTSPTKGAPSELVNQYNEKKETIPIYFANEGKNEIHSPYAVDTATKQQIVPNIYVTFEVYVDGTAPRTSAAPASNVVTYKAANGTIYSNSPLNITLSATDAVSGSEKIYYSTDGAAFAVYNQPISYTSEKQYTLKYYAADYVGNAEKVNEKQWTVDGTPPASSHSISGKYYNDVFGATATVSLSTTDNLSGVKKLVYRIDGGAENVYQGALSLGWLTEGLHSITYYATDNVGNKEQEKKLDFFMDKTAPIIVEEVVGDQFFANGQRYSSGRTKVKITAIDNKAGVKEIYYSVGGGQYQLYDKPFYLPSQAGNTSITSYAVDNVDNKSGAQNNSNKLGASYVDLTGPSVSHRFNGPLVFRRDTTYISPKTQVVLSGTDNESGMSHIEYSMDNGTQSRYDQPFTVSQAGLHQVDYFGYDHVNNSNQNNIVFKVDNEGPKIFFNFGVQPYYRQNDNGTNIDVYPADVVLFISATDNFVGYSQITYSVNGGGEKTYSAAISGFAKGKNTLKAKAYDKLGNVNEQNIVFLIE